MNDVRTQPTAHVCHCGRLVSPKDPTKELCGPHLAVQTRRWNQANNDKWHAQGGH